MTKSIRIALICLAILMLGQIGMAIQDWEYTRFPLIKLLLWMGVEGFLAFGIFRGNRLAWQWARISSLTGGVVILIVLSTFAGTVSDVLLLLSICALFGLFISLGRRDALAHFRLLCPDCGNKNPKAGGLLFKTGQCRSCGDVF